MDRREPSIIDDHNTEADKSLEQSNDKVLLLPCSVACGGRGGGQEYLRREDTSSGKTAVKEVTPCAQVIKLPACNYCCDESKAVIKVAAIRSGHFPQ